MGRGGAVQAWWGTSDFEAWWEALVELPGTWEDWGCAAGDWTRGQS